jgi:hypothetical protein
MSLRFPGYPDCVGFARTKAGRRTNPTESLANKTADVYLGAAECDWPDFS